MHSREQSLQVYLDLADLYLQQGDQGLREVFLMLAADTALKAGRPGHAESLRQELLRENPDHAFRPFSSFDQAVHHPDLENYLEDLRQKYPIEVAREMLESVIPVTLPPPAPDVPPTMAPLSPGVVPPVRPGAKKDANEPLKVYREVPDIEQTQPPPTLPHQPRQPPPRPAPAPRARPAAPAARARPPSPRPAPPPMPARTARTEPTPPPDEDPLTSGAWVGTLLFMVVLAFAVALTMVTLVPHDLVQELIQGS